MLGEELHRLKKAKESYKSEDQLIQELREVIAATGIHAWPALSKADKRYDFGILLRAILGKPEERFPE